MYVRVMTSLGTFSRGAPTGNLTTYHGGAISHHVLAEWRHVFAEWRVMATDAKAGSWKPRLSRSGGPVYLAIADALAADIQSGRLTEGVRLPPQRSLAEALGIDFTTVTRAYAEAGRRGLIEGRVGQGSYVRRRPSGAVPAASPGRVDMSMNLPPRFDDARLHARMWRAIADLESSGGDDLLARYQAPGGATADRSAGAHWLTPRIPGRSADRVLQCPGTQGALLAVIGLLAASGETICTEALTYPGLRSLTAHLGIRIAAVDMDAEGVAAGGVRGGLSTRQAEGAVLHTDTAQSDDRDDADRSPGGDRCHRAQA